MNDQILKVIAHTDAIPSVPQIVARLLEITRAPDFKQSDVADLLSTDPGITADLLRMANSALFGVTRKVGELRHAITLLGMSRVRTLVLGRCMIDRVNASPSKLINTSDFWRRSLATAALTARFADTRDLARDTSFMAGLLSDVGVIVLARALPAKYTPVAKQYGTLTGPDLVAHETRAVGVSHPEISAITLERWNLPEAMVIAARYQHAPDLTAAPQAGRELAGIIGGAAEIARLLFNVSARSVIAATCAAAAQRAGIGLNTLPGVLKKIEGDIQEFAQILRVDILPGEVCGKISEAIGEPQAVLSGAGASDSVDLTQGA